MVKRAKRTKEKEKSAGRKKGPRSEPLPGMEQVRSRKLDNICEAIAEERATINEAVGNERGHKVKALDVMQHADPPYTVYKHGGVELVRVPGADKLRVHLTDDDGDASVSGGRTSQETSSEPAGG